MVINDIINTFCRTNDIIPDNQFGFRLRHSTIHAINKLASDIHWALNGDNCLGACRSFHTFHNNVIASKEFLINNGFQQGTINSPILFNIYTCDILRLFGLNNTNYSLIAYADDLIVYNANRNPLTIQSELLTCDR
ncbi:hypothetical protein P5V15_015844 [Pogonomyrmex californicus]